MGGDGGVIAANRKFLRQCGDGFLNEAQRESIDQRERKQLRTKVCAVSNEKLEQPIVACELGYLYNKDAVLTALLEKTLDATFSHLRGLKDLIEAKLTRNRENQSDDDGSVSFMCPVTFVQFTGRYPFCIIRSTGWVLSERALTEVGIESLQEEYGPFSQDDVIRLAPDDEELQALKERMLAKRELAKSEKAKSKRTQGMANDNLEEKESRKKLKKEKRKGEKAIAMSGKMMKSAQAISSSTVKQAEESIRQQKESSAVYGSLFGKYKPTAEQLFASGKSSCPI